jgi:hypothetical protein
MSDDLVTLGPAMRALTQMQRKFVLAMAADPFGNAARWARAAGYSDKSEAAKVQGHHLVHDPRIEAAAMEVARGTFQALGPLLATSVMLRAARNPKHPKQLRAAEMIANRVGLHEMTEHVVSVNHSDRTGEAMVERIKQLSQALGVDPAKLLGVNAGPVIEGEVIDADRS